MIKSHILLILLFFISSNPLKANPYSLGNIMGDEGGGIDPPIGFWVILVLVLIYWLHSNWQNKKKIYEQENKGGYHYIFDCIRYLALTIALLVTLRLLGLIIESVFGEDALGDYFIFFIFGGFFVFSLIAKLFKK